MRSAFDIMDRQFRQPDRLQPEPLSAGDECPSSKCRGRLAWDPITDQPDDVKQLACDCCGWVQERFP